MAEPAHDLTRKLTIVPFSGLTSDFVEWVFTLKAFAASQGIPMTELDKRLPALNPAKSATLYQLLSISLSKSCKSTLVGIPANDGNVAWKAIMNRYASASPSNVSRVMGMVGNVKLKDDGPASVIKLCEEVNDLVAEMRLIGVGVAGIELAARGQVCKQLPPAYAVIVSHNENNNPSWDEIFMQVADKARAQEMVVRPSDQHESALSADIVPGYNTDENQSDSGWSNLGQRGGRRESGNRNRGGHGGGPDRGRGFDGPGRNRGWNNDHGNDIDGGRGRGNGRPTPYQRNPMQCFICGRRDHEFLDCPKGLEGVTGMPFLPKKSGMQANHVQWGGYDEEYEEAAI